MEQEKALIEQGNKRKGIRQTINDIIEIIKSKIDKEYILSDNSPEKLKNNKSLIIRTIQKDYKYLNEVSDNILLEELNQDNIPENGIINTALKNGYFYDKDTPNILLGENAKELIIQYVEMQKKVEKESYLSSMNLYKLQSVIERIDENVLRDDDFRGKLFDLALERGYNITPNSPKHLLQNSRLVENYYKKELEDNVKDIRSIRNMLSPQLLEDRNFLSNYIDLLTEKGYDTETIVDTLIYNEDCCDVLKSNTELFQFTFNKIRPQSLSGFFEKFYTDEELSDFFANNENLEGSLLRLSKLYNRDNTILSSLYSQMLDEKYENIPGYKMQIIAKNSDFQREILNLNDFEYTLYSKMTQLVSQNTNRWNRFDMNIVNNLSSAYYKDLIDDLYEQAKQGNKINNKDIETLTFLFSQECITDELKINSLDKKGLFSSNNVFNITTKTELEHFDEIKELVCDTVLANPNLDDEQLTGSINRYLDQFKELSELDRMKLALLEKYYNMDMKEADVIVKKFSSDLENIPINDEYQASIVEQVKAIKNIYECNDMNMLNDVSNLDVIVKTDLSTSTYLTEETKEIFENLYKENFYMPKEDLKIGQVKYNDKSIDIYDADIDFSMIVKRVEDNEENAKKIWNSMTKTGGQLRYYTSTSYMTDENIADEKFISQDSRPEIILGFAQGTQSYPFDGMYVGDSHTPSHGGDDIYHSLSDRGSSYMTPSTLETNTDNYYNEIVVNTLSVDENGQMTKLQPDYIIYIKKQSDISVEDIEDDNEWEATKKVASEFGIPIVVVDKEKVRQSEKSKIENMSKTITEESSVDDIFKFIQKCEHYKRRYSEEDILEYKLKEEVYKKYAEQKAKEEKSDIKVNTNFIIEQDTNERENILKRQEELKEKNIINDGDER